MKTDCQATWTHSVEHATAARTVIGSSLCHFLLFGQNVGTCVNHERIRKKLKSVITLAGRSVISAQFPYLKELFLSFNRFYYFSPYMKYTRKIIHSVGSIFFSVQNCQLFLFKNKRQQ